MNETHFPGGPEMVKIDGARIRAIREQKGLTQLYVATAVEVTTDTVSRWENKRYPTIKKDNALRLAAALEVDLTEILEQEPEIPCEPASLTPETTPPAAGETPEATVVRAPERKARFTRNRLTVALTMVLLFTAATIVLILNRQNENQPDQAITVRRTAPPHFVAGQPFPVFLTLESPTDRTVSIILRESIPPGLQLGTTLPPISGHDKKDNSIKWLKKVTGSNTFAYTLHSDPTYQGDVHLDGTLKVTGSGNGSEIAVVGDSRLTAGFFHWADTNQDNRISDEEILAVYDLVGTDHNIDIDMDLIEDMWLGDGYLWQNEQQRFTVLE